MTTKTYHAKPLEVERHWWHIDATGLTLGRLASVIAVLLRGKHKPQFTPNVDTGDFVVVTNVEKLIVTGKKADQKDYKWHTGYVGNLKSVSFKKQLATHPERILEDAVKGMLPKRTLGHEQLLKLKIYAGPEHPHAAQQPKPYTHPELEAKAHG